MRNLNKWLIIAIIAIIASGMLLTLWTVQREENLLRTDLLTKTRLLQGGINSGHLEVLTGTEADLVSPDYQALKEQIMQDQLTDPRIQFIYILGQRPDGSVYFLVDSEPPESVDYSPPGQVYSEASAGLLNVFASGNETTEGPMTDRWGTWVSGLVPIRDSQTGEIIAVLGTDVDARDWNIEIINASAPAVIAMLLLLLLLLIFFYVLQRNERERQILADSEAAIKESESRYRTVFESTGTAMLIIEGDTTIAFANKEFFRLTGYSQGDIDSRKSWTEFVFKEDLEKMVAQHRLRRQRPDDALPQYEFRLVVKSGEIRNILLTIDMIPGTKRSIASLNDITHRIQMENALKESEENFRLLFEESPVPILLSEIPSGSITSANKRFLKDVGMSLDQVIGGRGVDLGLLYDPADQDRLTAEVIATGSIDDREVRFVNRQGMPGINLVSMRIVTLKKKQYCLTVMQDITELKVLEQQMTFTNAELNKYAEDLRQTNDKLNLLNTITRHDILNQLTVVLGYLEMMRMKFPDPSLQEYIDKEIHAAQNIQTQILFTKEYQDIGVQSPQWFDLKKVIYAKAATLPLPERSLTVHFDNLEVYADPLLEKVFYTLLENTLRHGKEVTSIEFSYNALNEGIVVIYEDNGGGVPAEYKEAIFDRKFFKHTGFGLFLSRTILGITGMTIRETGEPGKGARFEISVPEGAFRFTRSG
jgi:PAS domain S-box-containing protein